MAKSANYWKERMKALEDTQYKKTTEYYNDLQKQFRMAQNNLQMDIEYWYQRLAANNDISLAAAKKLLDKNELEEFHWTVEEYIKRGEENDLNQRWMKQLENASARVHINRLEAMKLQTQQHAEILYQNYEHGTLKFLSEIYEDGYYRTAYEIEKGTGIGSSFSRINTSKIDKIINTPWAQDGKAFSDRIWQNKDKLVRELHTELTQSLIRGENPDMAAKRLAKTMGSKLTSARTLVYTEGAAISSAAQKDSLQELGVEEFEVVETLDSHTCSTCGDMDGRHFPMKDFEIGVTAPPFHPRCRGCTCPYFDDEFTTGERIARGEDGKQYYVSENTTYNEWKNAFVYGNKSGFERTKNEKIQTSSGAVKSNLSNVHTVGKIDRNIYKCVTGDIITDEVIITDNQIQHIKDRHPNDYERFSGYFNQIVENPDYIIEANKPDTALILKEIECGGEVFKTVLRLVTSKDDPTYKNSIITFMKIDNKEWNRLLRNKTILYKRE